MTSTPSCRRSWPCAPRQADSFAAPGASGRFAGRAPGRGRAAAIYFSRTHKGEIWLLTLYSKAAADSIPGHVLKALKEEVVDEAL